MLYHVITIYTVQQAKHIWPQEEVQRSGCGLAGLAANLAPALLRSYEEEHRLQNEQQLFDKYMAMGMGPHHIGDDEQEVCCCVCDRHQARCFVEP